MSATEEYVELSHRIMKMSHHDQLRLLHSFILKRCVDGLNGRTWDAKIHYLADLEIEKRLK